MGFRKLDNPPSGDDAIPGKIFVGGINKDTTLDTFLKYFEKFGEIKDSVIMKDRLTGRSRGFGFIVYKDPSVVDRILEFHIIDGKQVQIKRTIPKGSSQANDDAKTKKKGSLQANDLSKTKKNFVCGLFVGGIPKSVSEDVFKNTFSKYGKVVEHEIVRDQRNKRSRGFGFIRYDNEKVVDNLLTYANRIDMAGTQVEIKKVEPPKSSDSGSLPPFASESRARSYNDGFSRVSDSYLFFGSRDYGGPGSYRSVGGYGGRLGDYGGYGSGDDFSGSFGGYSGGAGAGAGAGAAGYAGFHGESSFGYSGRYGSSMGGLGDGYGGGGLGVYGRGGGANGSYGGPGTVKGIDGPGAGYGGAGGGLYAGIRGSYGGSSRNHPYAR